MRRGLGLGTVLGALALTSLFAQAPDSLAQTPTATSGPRSPNLVLVSIDTLRADALSCYGGRPEIGQGICRWAERGTLHEWAFSTAPATMPSMASILSSLYPNGHGVIQAGASTLPDEVETLAEVLHEAG